MSDKTTEQGAYELMLKAFEYIGQSAKTRESSLAMTNLEQAMMWLNRDRSNKGQVEPNYTQENRAI